MVRQDTSVARTSEFMHHLAAEVDAVNIGGDETDTGYMIVAWIRDNDIERETAADIAAEHGFTVYGEVDTAGVRQPPTASERARIRFETEA